MPRAADSPTRSPVKLPGPVVTAIRSRAANARPACLITRAISGIRASAWPRFIACDSCAISLAASVSRTPAAQASRAVSMARISMSRRYHCFGGRARGCPVHPRLLKRMTNRDRVRRGLHRPDFDHVGYKMLQQILDAVLQRRGRRRATRAGAFHVEIDDAVLEAPERDVAAVIGDCRAHSRFDQVLDGRNRLGVGLVEELVFPVRGLVICDAAVRQQRRTGHVVLHDCAEDRRLEMLPVAVVFGYGYKVGAVKHAGHARYA